MLAQRPAGLGGVLWRGMGRDGEAVGGRWPMQGMCVCTRVKVLNGRVCVHVCVFVHVYLCHPFNVLQRYAYAM